MDVGIFIEDVPFVFEDFIDALEEKGLEKKCSVYYNYIKRYYSVFSDEPEYLNTEVYCPVEVLKKLKNYPSIGVDIKKILDHAKKANAGYVILSFP